MGDRVTWQEAVVALIVSGALLMLIRRFRGTFATQPKKDESSCHGCDDCGD